MKTMKNWLFAIAVSAMVLGMVPAPAAQAETLVLGMPVKPPPPGPPAGLLCN